MYYYYYYFVLQLVLLPPWPRGYKYTHSTYDSKFQCAVGGEADDVCVAIQRQEHTKTK